MAKQRSKAEGPRAVRHIFSTQQWPQSSPNQEDIRRRAYDLYLARGAGEGDAVDDWLKAEQELQPREPERNPNAA
jgi:hypothetical protein